MSDEPQEPSSVKSDWIRPVSVAVPVTIFAVSALAFPLAVAPEIGLGETQRTTWIFGPYLLPALASLLMTWYYQLPLIVGWSGPAIIFLSSIAGTSYSDMIGAMLVTGVMLIVLGLTGLSARIAPFIPSPIVYAVVAGSILPFLINAFNFLQDSPLLIGVVLLTYLVSRKWLEPPLPSVLVVFAVGVIGAWISGETGSVTVSTLLPEFEMTGPTFSLSAIVTITPVFVVLIVANSNLSGSMILKGAGFNPPRRMIDVVSGVGVMGGSLFGTIPLALATNLTAMTAATDAGPMNRRHWSVYASVVGFMLIAGAAAIAADLPNLIPMSLMLTVAALAMLGVFIGMLGQVIGGPIKIGPAVALAVALSDLTLLGFGSFFWALVIGTFVTRFLEPQALSDHCSMVEDAEKWCR